MPRPLRLVALMAVTLASCTTTDPEATPSPTPTVTPGPRLACSAQDLDVTDPADLDTLPADVATTRSAIIGAARACDFEELQELAKRGGDTFAYGDLGTLRGDQVQPGVWWRDREAQSDEVTARLVALLSLRWDDPEGLTADEADGADRDVTVYLWPRAWNVEESDDEDWAALDGIYSSVDVAGWRSGGIYGGERVMITEQGRWLAFSQVPAR